MSDEKQKSNIRDNMFFKELVHQIQDEKRESSMSEWICENTTLAGKKFSFKGHEFQIDIANDMHPNITVKKLSQMGITEVMIRKTLGFLVRNNGTRAMYSFPTILLKNNNAKTRMKPLMTSDFPQRTDDVRSTDLMQINDSFLYMASCSEADATSNPVDLLVLDELDLSDPEIVSLYNSRLQHSSWKMKWRLSTPTFASYGIDAAFESSDQRQYFYRCQHCGHWHVPKFDLEHVYIPNLPSGVEDLVFDINPIMAATLDYENSYVCCPKCRKPLDLSDSSEREWVAKFTERSNSHHGYQILPFSSSILSLKYLIQTVSDEVSKNHTRRAMNTILGETYSDGSSRLEVRDIESCFASPSIQDIPEDAPIYLGLDMGVSCHLVVLSENGYDVLRFEIINMENVVDRIKWYLDNFKVVGGMVDRHPFIPTAYGLRDCSEGRISPCVYASSNKRETPVSERDGTIAYYGVDRTMALDAVAEKVRRHEFRFYGYGDLKETIITHLRDMFREDSVEDKPKWVKMQGTDHFFHALGYALTAIHIKRTNDLLDNKNPNLFVDIMGVKKNNLECYDILSYNSTVNGNKRIISRR